MTSTLPPASGSEAVTILVAEDHADSREALRALLEATGYNVRVATNGREAIDAALASPPDLILMDLMMPEVDGFHATRALRAREEFRDVPILALTAMEGSKERALAAGCDDYMLKPIDVRTFLGSWQDGWRRTPHRAATGKQATKLLLPIDIPTLHAAPKIPHASACRATRGAPPHRVAATRRNRILAGVPTPAKAFPRHAEPFETSSCR